MTILNCIDKNKLMLIDALEENKTIDTVLTICEEMTKLPQKRNIHLVSIGGGIRVNLNFAHTFGHAIESVTKYKIPHGTAVTMGMIVANRISLSRGIFEERIQKEIENLVKENYYY